MAASLPAKRARKAPEFFIDQQPALMGVRTFMEQKAVQGGRKKDTDEWRAQTRSALDAVFEGSFDAFGESHAPLAPGQEPLAQARVRFTHINGLPQLDRAALDRVKAYLTARRDEKQPGKGHYHEQLVAVPEAAGVADFVRALRQWWDGLRECFVAQDAEFVLRFDTDASPYHQDVHTGTPAFVRAGWRILFDLEGGRVMSWRMGGPTGPEALQVVGGVFAMNAAAAGHLRRTDVYHARLAPGLSLSMDIVERWSSGNASDGMVRLSGLLTNTRPVTTALRKGQRRHGTYNVKIPSNTMCSNPGCGKTRTKGAVFQRWKGQPMCIACYNKALKADQQAKAAQAAQDEEEEEEEEEGEQEME